MMSKAIKQTALVSLAIFAFQSAPALANYDKRCLSHLQKTPVEEAAFDHLQAPWMPTLKILKGTRSPTNVEYEAWMDLNHELPLIGVFADGKRAEYSSETPSLMEFARTINNSVLVEVEYVPDSLKKLGDVFKEACNLLKRPGCELYDGYPGLSSPLTRPFTPVEEQALKWTTFHLMAGKPMARSMTGLLRAGRKSVDAITAVHITAEKNRIEDARYLILATFNSQEAIILFDQLVQPYISASFARTLALFKGSRLN